jgi:hypothetical protein
LIPGMLVRPSRCAYGIQGGVANKRKRDGGDKVHQLIVNEMNFYYRPGCGTWYNYRENGDPLPWAVLITVAAADEVRPDLCSFRAKLMFSTKYLHERGYDYDSLLPKEATVAGAWVLSDIDIDLRSDQVYSHFVATEVLARDDKLLKLHSFAEACPLLELGGTDDESVSDPSAPLAHRW